MDLLASIRKSGSRGGVNFSWDDVQTSQHRENYLGHSLMAPVGRWQKGRDLSWYAKADDDSNSNETAEEKRVRERKEEIKRIKEAEEDALARALGLPVPERNGAGTGANNIDVGEMRRVIKETEAGDDEIDEVGKAKGFGDFVGSTDNTSDRVERSVEQPEEGGLLRRNDDHDRKSRRHRQRGRDGQSRSRSRERKHRRHRHRSRSAERHQHRQRNDERSERRERSRSPDRRERRHRSRSFDRRWSRRDDQQSRRDVDRRPRRSQSPDRRRDSDRGHARR